MLRSKSADDRPMTCNELHSATKSKYDSRAKPILFDIGDDINQGEITVTDKLNKLIMILDTTASRLTRQAEGYDASTKFLLEKIQI